MFEITGFSRLKFLGVSVMQILLCSAIVTVIHLMLPIEMGELASTLIILIIYGLGLSYSLFYINSRINRHTEIMQHIVSSIDDKVVVKDYEGSYIFCNKTLSEIYEADPDVIIGKNDDYFSADKELSDFLHNSARSVMDKFQKKEIYKSMTDISNGEVKHFKFIKIPFHDVQNKLKIFIIAKDITDIVKPKEQADKDRVRLENVLEVSEEGLWIWNVKNNKISLNDRSQLITGIQGSEHSFEAFRNCVFPEDREEVLHALNMLAKHNQPYNIEFRIKLPDGKVIWVWDRGRVVEYDDGEPIILAGIIQNITEKKHNQQKVEYLAYYDQLTGLINRTQLKTELKKTFELSQQKQCFSALLILDLDRFKILNDSYGHDMGDQLLRAIVKRLNKANQEKGIISRFGGDEFVIILPLLHNEESTALKMAQQHATCIAEEISAEAFTLKSDIENVKIEYAITASIGGIIFNSDGISTDRVLQVADNALQRVKFSGGNATVIYDLSMVNELKNVSELKKTIHGAIANNEFCIFLQPKYNANQQIIGAEALIRWLHPKLGLLFPGAFIDLAEESNMILPIGDFVLAQGCQQLKIWQTSPTTKHLELSVNLSAKQIWQSHFVEHFIQIVESYNIDHTKLVVEITESVLIQDMNDAAEKLTRLKEYGVSISLDDFGTGYSSLNYLRSLPIDEVKIDRSFINDISNDKQARIMVKSIVDLAKNFEMEVISEGVESEEQLTLLKYLGISSFQGFYFSKPLPIDDMDKLLHREAKV